MPFEPLDDAENIIEIQEMSNLRISFESMQVVSNLIGRLNKFLLDYLIAHKSWTDEGKKARFLKLGSSQWVTGKIRFRLVVEFCPDEPETPALPASGLDEFRK